MPFSHENNARRFNMHSKHSCLYLHCQSERLLYIYKPYVSFSASTKCWQLLSVIIQGIHLNSSFCYSVSRSLLKKIHVAYSKTGTWYMQQSRYLRLISFLPSWSKFVVALGKKNDSRICSANNYACLGMAAGKQQLTVILL